MTQPSTDAVANEAEERRRGDAAILDRLTRVEDRLSEQVLITAKLEKGLRLLRIRARKDVSALTEELAKANRRLMVMALAALLYAFGAVPEVRGACLELLKKAML